MHRIVGEQLGNKISSQPVKRCLNTNLVYRKSGGSRNSLNSVISPRRFTHYGLLRVVLVAGKLIKNASEFVRCLREKFARRKELQIKPVVTKFMRQ